MPRITVLKKEGRRIIENADDLTWQLKQRFSGANFEILEGKAVATMSLKEQVRHVFLHLARVNKMFFN